MTRYGDLNALREQMFNYYDCVNEGTCKGGYSGQTLMDYEVADLIRDCIENAPTADVVEVVRCRDCISFHPKTDNLKRHCNLTGIEVEEDDFCSYGERDNGKSSQH